MIARSVESRRKAVSLIGLEALLEVPDGPVDWNHCDVAPLHCFTAQPLRGYENGLIKCSAATSDNHEKGNLRGLRLDGYISNNATTTSETLEHVVDGTRRRSKGRDDLGKVAAAKPQQDKLTPSGNQRRAL